MKKIFFYFCGFSFLILAIIGVFLPLIPATPFALLATYFLTKADHRFEAWCLKLPFLGPAIGDWQRNKTIRPRAKIFSIICILTGLSFLWITAVANELILIIVTLILGGVVVFILTRPSKPSLSSN